MTRPSLVTLIAGPTASGKSALALKMARESGAVVINADSQQLYADLRILTARPSEADEALVDHRLYGVADAADAWSVGRWSREVLPILDTLRTEGRPAILVGGTGLYFMALTKGLADIPAVPPQVRERVEANYLEQGETVFRTCLALHDPQAAASIEQGDRQRLVRAMSVLVASGRPLSAWRNDTQPLLSPDSWSGLVIEPDRTARAVRERAGGDRLHEADELPPARRVVTGGAGAGDAGAGAGRGAAGACAVGGVAGASELVSRLAVSFHPVRLE